MKLLIQQQRPTAVQANFAGQPNQPRNPLDPYDEVVQQQRQGEAGVLQRLLPVKMRSSPGPSNLIAGQQNPASGEQQVSWY